MIAPQLLEFHQYEDLAPTITMSVNGSIAGGTYTFTARTKAGAVIVQKKSSDGSITITTAGTGSTPGVIQIVLTSAETALFPEGESDWNCWRNNSGSKADIAFGVSKVAKAVAADVS